MTLGPYELNSIYTGDARELATAIPDGSVDLIFTDPPYGRECLDLYEWLAEAAARVLKPGAFCLAMCGGLYLPTVFDMMGQHLSYFWLYDVKLTGQYAPIVWPRGNQKVTIVCRVRRVVAYCNGDGLPRTSTLTLYSGGGSDKRYHAWGQDGLSTRYFVDCFSAVGDVVLDPFCGGGTTPAMCKMLRRRFVSFDTDPHAVASAQSRLEKVQMPLPEPGTRQLELA